MKFSVSLLILSTLISPAFAVINIDYVSGGNDGNTADASVCSAASYTYNSGTHEVIHTQYKELLNAKGMPNSGAIGNAIMPSYGITQAGNLGSFNYKVNSSLANHPVANVSWGDATRFVNWMMNGQGSSDMDSGNYTLTGTTGIITKNIGAQDYLPNEDEWYQAAYYHGMSSASPLYPNGKSRFTYGDVNVKSRESTKVGRYHCDASSYVTFSQGVNVAEWNEAVIFAQSLGVRGGHWFDDYNMKSSTISSFLPSLENNGMDLSVASVPISTSIVLIILASGTMLIRRRR